MIEKNIPKAEQNDTKRINEQQQQQFIRFSKRFCFIIFLFYHSLLIRIQKQPILEADWPIFEMNKINNDQTQPTTKTCESGMNDDDVTFQRITIGQFSNSRRQK
ncbi:hypothetical protein DERP_015299 [Dermatophagoides pteronyssinus]|uniref:Transmembrane protein n=1 Tax=Dermatophagoides pteronyssinus TaxID=6956 RepID=A0ABQ8JTN1_DERPT|nr:hypothetical protein DERP_015299 [Dermatophagoides pteronyssinus]